jgi:hypothetical protein
MLQHCTDEYVATGEPVRRIGNSHACARRPAGAAPSQAECGAAPHPAAPVQHQPKPCCTVLRLAPGRCGGRGKRRRRRVTAGGGVRPGGRGEKGRLDFLYVVAHSFPVKCSPQASMRLKSTLLISLWQVCLNTSIHRRRISYLRIGRQPLAKPHAHTSKARTGNDSRGPLRCASP